jgi:hypothetical protein
MTVTDALLTARRSFTEEDLALLRHLDRVADATDESDCDELSHPDLLSFRERLVLGDISW